MEWAYPLASHQSADYSTAKKISGVLLAFAAAKKKQRKKNPNPNEIKILNSQTVVLIRSQSLATCKHQCWTRAWFLKTVSTVWSAVVLTKFQKRGLKMMAITAMQKLESPKSTCLRSSSIGVKSIWNKTADSVKNLHANKIYVQLKQVALLKWKKHDPELKLCWFLCSHFGSF